MVERDRAGQLVVLRLTPSLCAHQGEDVRHCVHRTKAPHRVHVSAVLLQSRSLESP